MISIITVCYNSEKTIERTLDSVINQVYIPKEYIIVDGLSSDRTLEIIDSYKVPFVKKGINLKVVSEKDRGLYDAMNKGVQMASQKWIHFLNSDDYYVNQYVLSSMTQFLSEAKEDIVYGAIIKERNGVQKTALEIRENKLKINMLFGCPIAQPATFYRSTNLKNYPFDISYKISADYKQFVEMIRDKIRFKYVPYFIAIFGETGVSSLNSSTVTKENIRLLSECKYPSVFIRLSQNNFFRKLFILFLEFISRIK